MPHYNFKKDLIEAKKTEKEVGNLLPKVKECEVIAYEDTNKYDILVLEGKGENAKKTKYEVKEDFLCEFTGNVGLEFECRGKSSGIQTTEADYYVYKVHTKNYGIQIFQIPVSILKEMIEDKLYFRIVSGGDVNSNSKNYLFRYSTFVKNAVLLSQYVDKPQSI